MNYNMKGEIIPNFKSILQKSKRKKVRPLENVFIRTCKLKAPKHTKPLSEYNGAKE